MKRVLLSLIFTIALVMGADKPLSDDALYDQVRLKLTSDPNVNGGAMEVEVKGGMVTLKGRVRNEKIRARAEKVVKKVKGVKGVDNQLRIDTNAP
ncbi:MAG: BON domain-containing protein [Bryobacteraceae bacterium]